MRISSGYILCLFLVLFAGCKSQQSVSSTNHSEEITTVYEDTTVIVKDEPHELEFNLREYCDTVYSTIHDTVRIKGKNLVGVIDTKGMLRVKNENNSLKIQLENALKKQTVVIHDSVVTNIIPKDTCNIHIHWFYKYGFYGLLITLVISLFARKIRL